MVSAQHPFTGIVEEDVSKLEDASDEVRLSMRSKGYDLVLNGVELGSGSIRIHQQDVQARVFRALGLSDADGAQPLRLLPRRADLRHASARRHRAGTRPRCGAARGRKVDPRSHRIPEDREGAGLDGRRAIECGYRPARYARHSIEATRGEVGRRSTGAQPARP